MYSEFQLGGARRVGIEGVGYDGGGWAPSPETIIFVPRMITLDAF